MPFQIVRSDIARMQVDAVVNTANPMPLIGSGVDERLHRAAGPELLQFREQIGPIAPGDAAVSSGFRLPARYVIHTVGPGWQGGSCRETDYLSSCYSRCLELAVRCGCSSIAFPLIGGGNCGFPKEIAMAVAVDAIRRFLREQEMLVYLVVYDRESVRLSQDRYRDVLRFLETESVPLTAVRDSFPDAPRQPQASQAAPKMSRRGLSLPFPAPRRSSPGTGTTGTFAQARPPAPSPQRMEAPSVREPAQHSKASLFEPDAGFSETLLKRIDETGKKDSEIYTRANVSRQHFSKIRNNPHYKPTKATAIAFAIALELDLEQTADLIGRAGYALTRSSRFDLIIMYFIRMGCYDLFTINAMLFDFDQPLLGA